MLDFHKFGTTDIRNSKLETTLTLYRIPFFHNPYCFCVWNDQRDVVGTKISGQCPKYSFACCKIMHINSLKIDHEKMKSLVLIVFRNHKRETKSAGCYQDTSFLKFYFQPVCKQEFYATCRDLEKNNIKHLLLIRTVHKYKNILMLRISI